MPEATEYITDTNSIAWQAIEAAYVAEMTQRGAMIKKGWDYYNGDHALPLKPQKDGYDDNVTVNHVETLAEKLASFLIGDGVAFEADSSDDQTSDDIKKLWEDNHGDILQSDIALAGAIEGHNAVRIMPQVDRAGALVAQGIPRLRRIQQKHFAAFWDAFDMQRVLWYRLQSAAGGAGRRIDYVRGVVDESGAVDHNQPVWTEVIWSLAQVGSASSPFSTSD
jgi:hypothetical protein